MPFIPEPHVRRAVALWLRREGYGILDPEKNHGVDIRARHVKYSRFFFVEAKGDPTKKASSPDSSRTAAFWTAIGQIATRMNTWSRNYYGVAFPESFRKKVKNLPWIFCKKNHLSVFLVDKKGKVECFSWKELKNLKQNVTKKAA